MRAIGALIGSAAAGSVMFLGVLLILVGTFATFPLVFSVLFWVIGLRPTLDAALLFVAGLGLVVLGFGGVLIGTRIGSRVSRLR